MDSFRSNKEAEEENPEAKKQPNGTSSISSEVVRSSFKIDEAKQIKQKQNKCCTSSFTRFMKKYKIFFWIDKVILFSICAAVAGGFTVPIIIYAVDTDSGNSSKLHLSDLTFDICSTTALQENFTNASRSEIPSYNDNCAQYSGICAEHLKHLGSNNSLSTLTLNGLSQDDVSTFANYINEYSTFIRKQCLDAMMPFLCQYFFPPCNVSGDNLHIISKAQCTNIRDALCSVEWSFATNIPAGAALLPNCESFSDNDNSSALPIVPIESQPLQCHHQFKEYCGLCLPLCGKFRQYHDETYFKTKYIYIVSSIIGFIGGILVFIASAYRRKAMLDFPSVLVVYDTVCAFILACVILIPYIGGQERLHCAHERLDIAYNNPSVYCQMSGFLFQWGLMLLAEFWLLHVIHLFIKIAFPMWSRKLDRKQTKIFLHVVEVCGALFLTTLAPTLIVILSKYQFGRFPPVMCFPSKEVTFYTTCLPLCIILAIGTILAVIMFWMLHKLYFNTK